MIVNFLSGLANHPLTLTLLGAAVGAAPYLYLEYAGHLMRIPAFAKVKAAYPAINYYLKIASDILPDETLPGMVADAAAAFWSGRNLTEAQTKAHVAATLKHFSRLKYVQTNFSQLSPDAIAQGEALAKQLLPKQNS